MALAAHWLTLIYKEIHADVLADGYVQVDETVIKYLAPGHGTAKQGYLWTCAKPKGDVVFAWHTSRAADCLPSLIPSDFAGIVQCDGYSAYPAFVREHNAAAGAQLITLGGCMAHVRREIFEACESAPRHAGWLLRQISHLYKIEEKLRAARAGPALIQAFRAAQSRPIFERIYAVIHKIRHRHLPQSAFGKAMTYALNQRPALETYLADGRIQIDNNGVEPERSGDSLPQAARRVSEAKQNAIRPTAVGKKNFLFFGSAQAGQRGAVLYTIIESCRRRSINPFEYLHDVFTRMPSMKADQIRDLTPEAWAKARRRPAPVAQAA